MGNNNSIKNNDSDYVESDYVENKYSDKMTDEMRLTLIREFEELVKETKCLLDDRDIFKDEYIIEEEFRKRVNRGIERRRGNFELLRHDGRNFYGNYSMIMRFSKITLENVKKMHKIELLKRGRELEERIKKLKELKWCIRKKGEDVEETEIKQCEEFEEIAREIKMILDDRNIFKKKRREKVIKSIKKIRSWDNDVFTLEIIREIRDVLLE